MLKALVSFLSRWSWIIALVAMIGSCSLLQSFIPKSHCKDGWYSTSIGSPGACSHHGGVEHYEGRRLGAHIGALIIGLSTWFGLASWAKRRNMGSPVANQQPGPPSQNPAPPPPMVSISRASAQGVLPNPNDMSGVDVFDAEIEEEEDEETPGGPFICPECGGTVSDGSALLSPAISAVEGDPWGAVLETLACSDCGRDIPAHLALRFGGISVAEAKEEWRSVYRGHKKARRS